MSDKLNISNEMARFDLKDRDFYDSLDEQECKKFSPFLMIRWGASISGDPDLQAYYLMSTNEHLNKHFFDISSKEHKKFQWLLATTVSPGLGKQYHKWLAAGKKDSVNTKAEKFLAGLHPHLNTDEIRLMAKINDKKDLKALAQAHGIDDRQIKDLL